MGVLARITGGKNANKKTSGNDGSLATGSHAIDKSVVLSPTDPTVINPLNPGTWQSIRTAPINDKPRYSSKVEADALKKLSKEKTEGARQAKRAYKSLKKIETADALVHKYHRDYISGVADAELTKKRADAKTARHLHAIRPEYAKLGNGLERAENNADKRIAELKAKVKDNY